MDDRQTLRHGMARRRTTRFTSAFVRCSAVKRVRSGRGRFSVKKAAEPAADDVEQPNEWEGRKEGIDRDRGRTREDSRRTGYSPRYV